MKEDNYDFFKSYEKDYTKIPVMKEIYGDDMTPIGLVKKLDGKQLKHFLFESKEDNENTGRYSYLGFQPKKIIRGYHDYIEIELNGEIKKDERPPLEFLKVTLEEHRMPRIEGYPSFVGGYVGYFTFEFFGLIEHKVLNKDTTYPFYELMEFDKIIVFDHLRQRILLIASYESKDGEVGYKRAYEDLAELKRFVKKEMPLEHQIELRQEEMKVDKNDNYDKEEEKRFLCNFSKEEFKSCVEKVKNYIREGDVFQTVISRRFCMDYDKSLIKPYRVMRRKNPSPYMYYITTPTLEIAGTSPETLVKLKQGILTTFPVAGTRPRGKTKEEDERLEVELLKDEKELSEHNMLVDLARNDIGKISEIGSVNVAEYMQIHRFSKVMHIASIVTGKLKNRGTHIDGISAILPAGTLSGAPKIRAVEIIKEIEKEPRGVYGGGIGYLSYNGEMDICIGIRTAVKKENKVYVQAGCGIVIDSEWEKEYEESSNKASAIMEAFYHVEEVD